MSIDDNFLEADKVIEQMSNGVQKELLKAYSESLKSLRSSLSYIYEKYSLDGSLTYADMTKYNRLVLLEKEIRAELLNLTGKNEKLIKTLSADVYQEAYFRAAFAIEVESQLKLGYGMINTAVIEASIQNPISGLTLNQRLQKSRDNIILNIRQQITQGLVLGESYPKMAKRIKATLECDAQKAIRVVKTESHRVQQEGRLASMEHAANKGVKMLKVWDAALDSAVRKTHAALDGQKVALDEEFKTNRYSVKAPGQFGVASEDINCRCTVRAEIAGYETKVRRSREDGIIAYKDYTSWMAEKKIDY